jgi:hypothetical protein
MGATSFAVRSEAQRVVDDLDGLLDLCLFHIHHEDEHVHPALEHRRPGSSAGLGEEHDRHQQFIRELRSLAAKLSAAPREQAQILGRALYLRYSLFVGENIAHMAEEELVIQPLLEELYHEGELHDLHNALVASIGPNEMSAFLYIMIPAINRTERFDMLSMARTRMPPPAFSALLAAVRPGLSDTDWSDLHARLAEKAA